MKMLLILILLILTTSTGMQSQTTASRQKQGVDTEAQVQMVNREWFEALRKGDAAAFDRLTTQDFVITNVSGDVRNKKQMLSNNPAPRFDSTETYSDEDVNVRIYGGTAIITGRITTKTLNKPSVSFRYTNVYVKQAERWKTAASQLTRIGAQ